LTGVFWHLLLETPANISVYQYKPALMKSIVILISGRGSNMEAIMRANLPVDIRAVISNKADAKGLQFAAEQGITTRVVEHKQFATREEFDLSLANVVDEFAPDYIILAGFMRILGANFIARYPNRIINIHPSLLPQFPGLHTHREALAAGVKLHGATVHIVTPMLDCGPILGQISVPVLADDTEDSLAERVLIEEHRLYPDVIRKLIENSVAEITT
jgi:phosphoribosylglycinamide formyltransferase 1